MTLLLVFQNDSPPELMAEYQELVKLSISLQVEEAKLAVKDRTVELLKSAVEREKKKTEQLRADAEKVQQERRANEKLLDVSRLSLDSKIKPFLEAAKK